MKIKFHLTRPARKAGGDRYEAELEGEQKPMVIYLPQKISRQEGEVAKEVDVTFDVYS